MKILLSIKPEFALKIFNGSKRYEYRRTIFKQGEVKTVVVYASDPVKQVIGEFEIGEILYEEPEVLWAKTKNQSGITRNRFLEYFDNKPKGYAIEVKVAQTYDIPIPLKNLMVPRPPQSFRYLW
jgi:predicted transcriptional regulator